MIEILIVDDSRDKIDNVKQFISEHRYKEKFNITVCTNVREARSSLIENVYDLLILDIQLPEFAKSPIKQDAGINLLTEVLHESNRKIQRRSSINRPSSILVLTAHEDSILQFEKEFSDSIFNVAKFDGYSDSWHIPLAQSLEHLIALEEVASTVITDYNYDIGIICALKKELDYVLKLNFDWESERIPYDSGALYFKTTSVINGKQIKIICTTPNQMGITDSTIATMKMIDYYKPRCIFMLGIMGGIKSKVNMGDIVFANPCYSHESGKYTEDADKNIIFHPTSTHVNSSVNLSSIANELSYNNQFFKDIHDQYSGNKPETIPNLHIGPISSGNAVIANESILDGIIKNERNLLGIDMEIYGLYRACYLSKIPRPDFIAFKSVSDYADHTKADDIQAYCSYISSKTLEYLLNNMLVQNQII